MSTTRYVLLLGSNVADGRARLAQAVRALAARWPLEAAGPIRITDGVAPDRAHRYANQALRIAAGDDREALKGALKQVEADFGRGREASGSGEVALDIDIVAGFDADGRELWRAAAKTPSPELRALADALAPPRAPA